MKRYLDNLYEQMKMQQTEPVMVSSVLKLFFDSMHYDAQSFSQKGQSGIDFALMHDGKPAVIIEAKRPDSSANISQSDPNKKALHEAILYFMRERDQDNYNLYHIIITNFYQWYIFDAKEFDKLFWQNKEIRKIYENIKNPSTLIDKTKEFYKLLQNELSKQDITIEAAYVDLQKPMSESQKAALYKLFSKEYLFKTFNPNDANKLDRGFYNELLYILGLEEKKVGGKKIIDRATTPHMASLYENIARNLEYTGYRADFEIVLQLLIIWMNRILFMKLFEAQLLQWNSGEERYKFLHIQTIKDFDVLKIFFFDILARPQHKRVHKEYEHIPYLNSSLFEISPVEKEFIDISNLEDNCELPYYSKTVLRDENGKRRKGSCNVLQYLFEFLDAYDFSSEGKEEITKDNKTLINAAVLGLIFEKLNGYKEGSYYTPSFVTMYMARETIERAIIKKFNTLKGWKCKTLADLDEKIEDKKEANEIINSLTICDPAVGSGHFLVSALNTILAIKSELRLLYDVQGKRIKDYTLEVENDELIIRDDEGEIFEYRRGSQEGYRIQRAIFEEKKRIIENSLFGADINPNAAHIARLRLWIELLKHSYYDENGQLVTMPNIDINIKVGNSLVSRYGLHDEITIPNIQYEIEKYKKLIREYKDGIFEGTKEQMQESIERLKEMFGQTLQEQWKQKQTYKKKLKEYVQDYGFDGLRDEMMLDAIQFGYGRQGILFMKENDDAKKQKRLLQEIEENYQQIEEIRSGRVYENAFEWRFEFPEVLDEEGNFVGFDVILANPPYILEDENKEAFNGLHFTECYQGKTDIWHIFTCRAIDITKDNGYISFIAKNQWLESSAASKMRRKIYDKTEIVSLIDFGPNMIFEEASQQTMIFLLQKHTVPKHSIHFIKFTKKLPLEKISSILLAGLQKSVEEGVIVGEKEIPSSMSERENLKFSSQKNEEILKKIERRANFRFNPKKEIIQGIIGGPDEAFIVDTEMLERFTDDEKKYLRNFHTNTQRYYTPPSKKYIIYLSAKNFKGTIDNYPNIKAFFEKNKELLRKKKQKYKTPHKPYFFLHRER
ncbi:N-6 DNA methylase [Nitratiruptor sp. YY08-13]|uniref:type IIG restriction enzyme/methyltransferase n=1 Tax=Nitratiruptor sp. YY08-13 TaxID=2724898 RepID=UPI001F412132|nr:N-6 DNA methylase [Nitratiruptor sp. YY08-13]